MADEHLLVDRDERNVVTLTMNRPEVRNAFGPDLMRALIAALEDLAKDDAVRAVVLTGAGKAFSAGADLTWMSSIVDNSFEENVEDSRGFERMLRAVYDAPMPVLARVNGHALGGAAGLLGCVDIAVAVRGAKFGFTEAKLGIAPAMISAYVQPRIGLANAHRYFLTGAIFDADRAREIGLVQEVCDPDDLDATFDAVLDEVLAAGPNAQRETKTLVRAIDASNGPDDSEQFRVELISRLRASDEAQSRIRAFLEGMR
jgi:methylglutaconyl-CoA hydratase